MCFKQEKSEASFYLKKVHQAAVQELDYWGEEQAWEWGSCERVP